MAEIEPSEETCSLHTCSSSRKQYLRGKVPIPRTTLWRSGYRKQLRSLKEKTEKGRKLYCRDPFMPVPRQTLHNWRAAEEETSVQDMAEVPEIIASLDVDQQQSGVRENKETVVHESLEGEGFEDISERSSVESIKDVEDEDGGGCGDFIAEGSWESHSDEEYSGGDVGIRNDSGSSDGSSDFSSNEGGDSSDDVCSDEVFVGDGVAVGGGGDSSDDIGGDGSAVGGGGSDWGADGGNDSCGIGRGGGGDGHDGNDGEDEGDKDSFQDAEQITHPQKEIPMAEKKCCRQQCKGSTVCNFVILPFEDHLLQLCEENWDKLQYPFTRRQETDMQHDLQDGSKYRALMQPGEFLSVPEHIGLILCSDGIPVFKSSGLQLWPIELCIANLPPEIRYNVQYLLVGGLWLGSVKPDMNKILKPILTRIKKLEDSETIIRTKVGNKKLKAKLILATFDLIAKAMAMNLTQFNGKYGCPYCLDIGTYEQHRTIYLPSDLHEPRIFSDVILWATMAQEMEEPVNDLHLASEYLKAFYEKAPELYPSIVCTANLHSVIHISQFVKDWGPLWCYSTFGYENLNGFLLRQCHGTGNVLPQFNPSVPNGIITACNVRQRSTALWKQHAPQLDVRLVVLPMSQHWIVHLWAMLPPHPQYQFLFHPSNGMLPSNPTMSSLPTPCTIESPALKVPVRDVGPPSTATVQFHTYNPSGILFHQINSVVTSHFLGYQNLQRWSVAHCELQNSSVMLSLYVGASVVQSPPVTSGSIHLI
eukprot:Em0006g1449a